MSTQEADVPSVLDIDEVAETLRISRRQIEKLLKEGAFPIPRLRGLGKRNRWSRASVERYLGGKP